MEPDKDRIAALVRQDLIEQFGDRYKFEPVIAERYTHYGYDEVDENNYVVWIGYAGCSETPDPRVINGISVRIHDELLDMGLSNVATLFVRSEKWDMTREKLRLGS